MKYFYLILILYCGLTQSCNYKTDIQFPYESHIKQELMPLKGLTTPLLIEIKSPFLIMQNWKQKDSLFHIYDLNTFELKSAFGRIGEGPKEFTLPWLIRTQLNDFVILDRQMLQYFEINKNGQSILKKTQEPRCINSLSEAAFINDSLFVVDAQYSGPNLYLFNMQNEFPKKVWKYRNQNIVDYIIDPNMGHLYANENRIAFCYEYKKEIDFMDTEFNLIKKVKFEFEKSDNSLLGSGNENTAYTGGYLGKRYLYVIYFGTSWNEYRKNSKQKTILEVFDLDGNPVARYHLDGKSPTYFAVDEKTYTLYGATEDGVPEDNLLVYKLKGLS